MNNTRREFLKYAGGTTSVILASSVLPRSLSGQHRHESTLFLDIRDPHVKELAQRALEAARAAGATYADIRLTRQRERQIGFVFGVNEKEEQMVGIRALVNGYWGFAAGAMWQPDAVVRLAREAVNLAKTNGLGTVRTLSLASAPAIKDEHWVMPVEIDPFDISTAEIVDFSEGMKRSWRNAEKKFSRKKTKSDDASNRGFLRNGIQLWKQEKAFGSTDGSYGTQVLYRTEGEFENGLTSGGSISAPQMRLDFLSPAAAGWEMFANAHVHEEIERAMEKYIEDFNLPVKPTDVGRYETVMDAESIARFASGTLGVATELDRALGYEANATGTSYLNTPFDMAGTFRVGAPALTVTVNRTERGAAATTGWDDEGIRGREVTLIDQGIVQTFQTTRESAGWLHQGVQQRLPLTSSGCACAQTGNDEPLAQTANLVIQPGTTSSDYEALVKNMDKGIAFENMTVMPDFQQFSGVAWGRAYEIQNGRKTAMLAGAGILFRAPEFWRTITALGGTGSTRRFGMNLMKGTPAQTGYHSVTAPAMSFKDVTVVDMRRKA